MNLKRSIRRYLGIEDLEALIVCRTQPSTLGQDFRKLRDQVETALSGIGRVIAKLEPTFAQDDLSSDKRAESDRIGRESLMRLSAENKARHHQIGDGE